MAWLDAEVTPPEGQRPSNPADPGDSALDDTDPNIMPPLTSSTYPSAAAPHPSPGQIPPGYPGGAGSNPPTPPRKSRRGRIVAVVAGAVVVVAAAADGIALRLSQGVSPATMVQKSGQAVTPAAGLTLTGTIAGGSANLTVTRAGTVEGSYVQGASHLRRITIQGVTYLKAPTAFWRSISVGQTPAAQAGGNWAKAPAEAVNMSFDSLTPARVARVLEHPGTNPGAVAATLDGTKVIRLSARGNTYYISTASPYRLIRIDGGSGTTAYSFDVTALDATTIGPAFTILHADTQALRGAVDPQALVLPLEKIRFGSDCHGVSSCTVSSKATVTAPGSSAVLVRMTVDFSAARNGTPFATCTATTATTSPGTVSQACGVGGPVWSHWFNSHTGNFTTWADAHFEAMVNSASDIAALQAALNQEQHGG